MATWKQAVAERERLMIDFANVVALVIADDAIEGGWGLRIKDSQLDSEPTAVRARLFGSPWPSHFESQIYDVEDSLLVYSPIFS